MVDYKSLGLVNTREMFKKAINGGYAIPAFNFNNMEQLQAIIKAAAEEKSPVILQVSKGARNYANPTLLRYMAQGAVAYAKELGWENPQIVLHLDHGDSFELCKSCIENGFSSVMIDGSHLPYEENVALTRRVADACLPSQISVEAELGKVGGKEDDLEAENDSPYTDPQQAKEFAERTNATSLAVAIGTAHGLYQGTPKLDFERLAAIREVVSIPLVLHGASGLSDEDVRDCVKRGICKVNFATELRAAYSRAVKELLAEKPDTIDPKAYGKTAIAAVKELVMARMKVCGCDGKAEK